MAYCCLFLQALTSECRTLRNVSILNSPFLSDAAFKCLASCRRLHKIRVEGDLSLFISLLFFHPGGIYPIEIILARVGVRQVMGSCVLPRFEAGVGRVGVTRVCFGWVCAIGTPPRSGIPRLRTRYCWAAHTRVGMWESPRAFEVAL